MYDRVNYPAVGATQLAFFSTPQGQVATLILGVAAAAAKVKTYRDTNMQNANVVPTKMKASPVFVRILENLVNSVKLLKRTIPN